MEEVMPIEDKVEAYTVHIAQNNFLSHNQTIRLHLSPAAEREPGVLHRAEPARLSGRSRAHGTGSRRRRAARRGRRGSAESRSARPAGTGAGRRAAMTTEREAITQSALHYSQGWFDGTQIE